MTDRDSARIRTMVRVMAGVLAGMLLSGVSFSWAAVSTATITLRERAEVAEEHVELGNIAAIFCDDAQLRAQLEHLVVGKAPLPGKSRAVRPEHIAVRLKQGGLDGTKIALQGAESVEVVRSALEISRAQIEQVIRDFINENTPYEKRNVVVKDIRCAETVLLPQGRISYAVAPPRGANLLGPVVLPILFKVNGTVAKKVITTAVIEVVEEVVVAKVPLARAQLITEDMVALETMNIAALPTTVITRLDEVVGKRTRRAVLPREPLSSDLVELPPLVKQGDVVMISAESETLRVSALGQVKEKGRRGERIRVLNLDSKKEVYALVVDGSTVQVEF
jgi:flagellar basal body P-ring formation protein FlgA